MLKLLWGFVLGATVVGGTLAAVWAASGNAGEVRVAARQLDDGRVEVNIQQREDDGDWGQRLAPDFRFLSSDAERDRWYVSSGVTLPDAAQEPDDLYCLVTHARPGDEAFWVTIFEGVAKRWDVYHDGISVAVKHGATPEAQAALIEECVDEGAVAIASSVAAPEAVRHALLEARVQGVAVASFNSGLEDFQSVGSARHVSVNDTAAGVQAGERLVAAQVSGTILCVIHEQHNTGLGERCDGLESGYANGPVERVHVAGVGDLAETERQLAQLLEDGGDGALGAIVTLNSQVGLAALGAVEQSGAEVVIATFDQTVAVLEAIAAGKILFAIDTNVAMQSWYTLSSLLFLAETEPRVRQIYGFDDPLFILGQLPILVGPSLFTAENAAAWVSIIAAIDTGGALDREVEDE